MIMKNLKTHAKNGSLTTSMVYRKPLVERTAATENASSTTSVMPWRTVMATNLHRFHTHR